MANNETYEQKQLSTIHKAVTLSVRKMPKSQSPLRQSVPYVIRGRIQMKIINNIAQAFAKITKNILNL